MELIVSLNVKDIVSREKEGEECKLFVRVATASVYFTYVCFEKAFWASRYA